MSRPYSTHTTAAALTALAIVASFKSALLANHNDDMFREVDFMWRLLIGLGCIPACIALYFRLTVPETPRFTMDIEQKVQQAALDVVNYISENPAFAVDPDEYVQRALAPKASRRDFFQYFSNWVNLRVLLGTCWSWFALDVRFFVCCTSARSCG